MAAIHPAVKSAVRWLPITEAPAPYQEASDKQRRWVFQTALDRHRWGTIMPEPGSGGDNPRTAAPARPSANGGQYFLTGEKHFGSGSGITSYMIALGASALVKVTGLSGQKSYPKRAHGQWQAILDFYASQGDGYLIRVGHFSESDAG